MGILPFTVEHRHYPNLLTAGREPRDGSSLRLFRSEPSLTLATISTTVSRRFSGCLVHFSIRSRKIR